MQKRRYTDGEYVRVEPLNAKRQKEILQETK